jgi:hypothetical protein
MIDQARGPMTVAELIERLSALPPDAEVRMLWDGACRSDVEAAWLCKGGWVAVGPLDEAVYYGEDRIEGEVQRVAQVQVWNMLGLPEPTDDDE